MNNISTELASGAQTRVLLLEDSHIDAELIAHQLKKLPEAIEIHRVMRRAEFDAALDGPAFDLIIADYSLPDFDGLSAMALAAEKAPRVPFVFISGVAGEQFATEAVRAGATDYVTKKDLSRVPMVVQRAIDESRQRQERQRAVDALVESEGRFRAIADSTPAFIWSVGRTGTLVFANRRFATESGRSIADVTQLGWRAVLHPEDANSYETAFAHAFQQREPFHAEVRTMDAKDVVRWLRCEAIPRYDASGGFVGYSGCAIDITESKLARDLLETEVAERTAELREKEEALRQSQKMEAIGQLTGGIAHDFNNMLAGILGSAELLRKRIGAQRYDECDRYIDAVIQAAGRAASLTQRMLAFSRRQSLDIRTTDINDLVVSLEEMLTRTLEEKIELKLDLAHDVKPALSDSNQLESAILNLAINARDAMPDGGILTISTRNGVIDPAEAARTSVAPGDYAIVSVADTGTGMSDEVQQKAFDPFFTTKPIGQGTGLGLSMVFGFARQLGGLAQITSREGEGTTIDIYLPHDKSGAAASVQHVPAAPLNNLDGASATVLVVEDEAIVQMLVVDTLLEWGFETLEANDAQSALKIIESDQSIDLMVTDVGLPGMDGRQLAEITRQHRPDLKILFATGYAEAARSRAGFLGEGMDLIAKPFDLAEFERKVKSLLPGG